MQNDLISRKALRLSLKRQNTVMISGKQYILLSAALEKVRIAPEADGNGDTSDGYHTFNELYDHRAKLFSVIVRNYPDLCWKAKLHHDCTMYDGMFIVGINTPDGQASYHYDIDPYWDMFNCKELDRAPEWDGHTPQQAIDRIAALNIPAKHGLWKRCFEDWRHQLEGDECSACGFQHYGSAIDHYLYCPNCGAKMDAKEEQQ